MTVSLCIPSIFPMHLHDKIGTIMPARLTRIFRSCSERVEMSEQFRIDWYKVQIHTRVSYFVHHSPRNFDSAHN